MNVEFEAQTVDFKQKLSINIPPDIKVEKFSPKNRFKVNYSNFKVHTATQMWRA